MKNIKIIFPGVNPEKVAAERTAVRAVISDSRNLLMVHPEKNGDYKLPGGGVETGEDLETALRREVMEECGAEITAVKEKIFIAEEFRPSFEDPESSFKMTSHYYLCEAGEMTGKLNLDKREADLGFRPLWILIDKALEANRKLMDAGKAGEIPWLRRETRILQYLKELL